MGEIKDKYLEPLVGEPKAFKEKVEAKKEDFIQKSSEVKSSQEGEKLFSPEKVEKTPEKKEKTEPIEKEVKKEELIKQSDDASSKTKDEIARIKKLKKEDQVKELCDLAFKDLDFSIEVAKRLESPYVLDEFHDSLIDQLYDKLVEEGKLKKI